MADRISGNVEGVESGVTGVGRGNQQTSITLGSDALAIIYSSLSEIRQGQKSIDDRLRLQEMTLNNLQQASNARGEQNRDIEQRLKALENKVAEFTFSMAFRSGGVPVLSLNRQIVFTAFFTFVVTVAIFTIYGQLFAR